MELLMKKHNALVYGPLKRRILESIQALPKKKQKLITNTMFFHNVFPDQRNVSKNLKSEPIEFQVNRSSVLTLDSYL